MEKITWQGTIVSVQPRIRLMRSFDERSHGYLGFSLLLDGVIGNESRQYSVGLGKAAYHKHELCVGDEASGECLPVVDPRKEVVEFYKVSKLKLLKRAQVGEHSPPPWHGVAVPLETYRARGHRRLAVRTFEKKCNSCLWGCRMPVEITLDQWNPDKKRYRFETFCYGPKSCSFYQSGPHRKVPGRKGMVHEELDWMDVDATSHRGPDE